MEITRLIRDMSNGDADAAEAVYDLVYDQLRLIARRRMAGESSDHTMQPTALVNEAYLRLVKSQPLNEYSAMTGPLDTDLLDLDDALKELEKEDPERAELVRLHFFSGLTIQECADLMEISKSTAERSWRFSRAWLKSRISQDESA